MHIIYEKYANDILSDKGFGNKIVNEIIDNLSLQVTLFCKEQMEYYKTKYGFEIKINLDMWRFHQSMIDALRDLQRLKDFHSLQYPNRIKCAAYLAYWWLQRLPMTCSIDESLEKDFFEKVEKKDISSIIHINAYWIVAYVFGELFSHKKTSCINEEFQRQWDTEFEHLFYYFCYRADSPKSIEAILTTTILHPVWEVKNGVLFEK